MLCPNCKTSRDKVVDSRESKDCLIIRRRRECLNCGYRFSTLETLKPLDLLVEKRDGRLEEFNERKLNNGIQKAFNKRSMNQKQIDEMISRVIEEIVFMKKSVIKSSEIAEIVLKHLKALDVAAYVCFWAMYGNFSTLKEFKDLIDNT
ncbi:MAG: transcriptional regulator NrdR [Patescibacteria group bacterium]